jgi:hypothetical protein
MRVLTKTLAVLATILLTVPALAGEAVPINATFGIQWTPIDWSSPYGRITESLGAAGLPNGKVLSIYSQDNLDAVNGRITSEFVAIAFSDTDVVYVKYEGIPAVYYPETNTASFFGPVTVLGGEGRFDGATGKLSIRTTIRFSPLPVGTFDIKGVIKTAD